MTETVHAGGKIESLKLAASEAVKPPAGMIEIEGVLRPRRCGFARHHELRCWRNHRLRSRLGIHPIETVMQCGHRESRRSLPCEARLYVIHVRSRTYFAMDVSADEHKAIEGYGMSLDDLIVWFGITLPPPVKSG